MKEAEWTERAGVGVKVESRSETRNACPYRERVKRCRRPARREPGASANEVRHENQLSHTSVDSHHGPRPTPQRAALPHAAESPQIARKSAEHQGVR